MWITGIEDLDFHAAGGSVEIRPGKTVEVDDELGELAVSRGYAQPGSEPDHDVEAPEVDEDEIDAGEDGDGDSDEMEIDVEAVQGSRVKDVAAAVAAGEFDGLLDQLEDVDDRQGVHKAIAKRRDELGTPEE